MCGRYSIYESMDHYLRQLELELVVIDGYDYEPINRYNVAPSTRVELISNRAINPTFTRWGSSSSRDLRRAVPRQQGFEVFHRHRLRQTLQHVS